MRSIRAAGLIAAAALAAAPAGAGLPKGRWVDLTHPFDEKTIYWPTEKTFELESEFAGETDMGYYYSANRFSAAEHGGTHMDAPVHFSEEGLSADEIPIEQLIGPAAVVDVTTACAENSDYQVSVQDMLDWEKAHGRLPDGAIVLLWTGFANRWPNRERYLGTAERGGDALKNLRFPGLSPKTAHWLATQRSIRAVGIDTASIDYGRSTLFRAHVTLFQKNLPVFENLTSLDKLPATGATVIALPMKIRGGSGGPLRIVALVEERR